MQVVVLLRGNRSLRHTGETTYQLSHFNLYPPPTNRTGLPRSLLSSALQKLFDDCKDAQAKSKAAQQQAQGASSVLQNALSRGNARSVTPIDGGAKAHIKVHEVAPSRPPPHLLHTSAVNLLFPRIWIPLISLSFSSFSIPSPAFVPPPTPFCLLSLVFLNPPLSSNLLSPPHPSPPTSFLLYSLSLSAISTSSLPSLPSSPAYVSFFPLKVVPRFSSSPNRSALAPPRSQTAAAFEAAPTTEMPCLLTSISFLQAVAELQESAKASYRR